MSKAFLLCLVMSITMAGAASAQKEENQKQYRFIYFDTDQWELPEPGKILLDQLLPDALAADAYSFKLHGHTDYVGTHDYNRALSERRVNSVKDYLLQSGIPQDHITTAFYGEERPAADNAQEEGRQANRRVKVVLEMTRVAKVTERPAPPPKKEIKVVERPRPETTPTPTSPCLEKGKVIRTESGTIVRISGCAYGDRDLRTLKVTVTDAISMPQILQQGLTTVTTSGECLETSGMVFVSITDADGLPVQPVERNGIRIQVPVAEYESEVQLYSASYGGGQVQGWDELGRRPKKTTEGEDTFYEILSSGNTGINLDKPTGIFVSKTADPRPYYRAGSFKKGQVRAYLSGSRTVVGHEFFKKHRFIFRGKDCIPQNDRILTIFARQNGRQYVFQKPLSEVRLKQGWFLNPGPRYVIKKKAFEVMRSEEAMQEFLASK